MKFTFSDSDSNAVRSYEPGRLVLKAGIRSDNLLLTGDRVETWSVRDIDSITETDFDEILALEPEVVLVGTGENQRILRPHLYRRLSEAGIGVEVMATAPAVRTFNVLLAEDRNVLAALII